MQTWCAGGLLGIRRGEKRTKRQVKIDEKSEKKARKNVSKRENKRKHLFVSVLSTQSKPKKLSEENPLFGCRAEMVKRRASLFVLVRDLNASPCMINRSS
jgi:energy-converting hydrogenase Eha subunit H